MRVAFAGASGTGKTTLMHDVSGIDRFLLEQAILGMSRYTHVVFCPAEAFLQTGDDPARVHDVTYQRIYDVVLEGFLNRYRPPTMVLWDPDLGRRKRVVEGLLRMPAKTAP